jgi:hypothetical protein
MGIKIVDRPPFHLNKQKLFCNRCNRWRDKFTETLVLEDEVHCLICDNWLCGIYDAFGDLSSTSPSIERIKKESSNAH